MGMFFGSLAFTAAVISWNNMQYQYYSGVFYAPYNGGYRVIAPPIGAMVPNLPSGTITVYVNGYGYDYYGGTFYLPENGGYQVVAAPPGAIVYNLPDGSTTINAGGVTLLNYNGAYFQPIQDENGTAAYEVVDMEK
jgi:hypothetical protein